MIHTDDLHVDDQKHMFGDGLDVEEHGDASEMVKGDIISGEPDGLRGDLQVTPIFYIEDHDGTLRHPCCLDLRPGDRVVR